MYDNIFQTDSAWTWFALDVVFKATVVLLLAAFACVALARASAALRHRVWGLAFVALLILPFANVLLPGTIWRVVPRSWGAPQPRQVVATRTVLPQRISPSFDSFSSHDRQMHREADVQPPVSVTPVAETRIVQTQPPILLVADASSRSQTPWLLLVWLAGCVVSLVPLLGGIALAAWLKRRCERLTDPEWTQLATDLGKSLGMDRRVELLLASGGLMPMTFGMARPYVVLPADAVCWTSEKRRAVLLHELAHIRRRDVAWQLVARVTSCLYWFHPLVWLALRWMRKEREHACDDCVLLAGQRASNYASCLLEIAREHRDSPGLAPAGLAIARPTQLSGRVLAVLDPRRARAPIGRRRAAVLILLTLVAVVALGVVRPALQTEAKSQAADNPKPAPTATVKSSSVRQLRVVVTDKENKPLPGAKVKVSVWTKQKDFNRNRDYECDANGVTHIELPNTLDIFRLWANHPGFAEGFENFQVNVEGIEQGVPKEFIFELARATVMGGVVKNEEGEPIQGAKVELSHKHGDVKLTDAEGRWKYDNVPEGDEKKILMLIRHPEYTGDSLWGDLQAKCNVTQEQLRAQTATIVMRRGIVLTGKVTDPSGAPIEGAFVVGGDARRDLQVSTRTDATGAYRLGPLKPGSLPIFVVAEGWAPNLRKIDVSSGLPPENFEMAQGKRLRIKLVDGSGKPIPNTSVTIQEWRGGETIKNEAWMALKDAKIPRAADANGIFEWDWAPEDAVKYQFSAYGYANCMASVTADGSEHVQIVHPLLRFSGTVRDAKSGEPIQDFLVSPIIYFRPDFPMVERRNGKRGTDGVFSLDLDRTDIEHGVQIEAKGFMTYRSPGRIAVGNPSPKLDVLLQPVDGYSGKVITANGDPAEGASIFAVTGFQHFDMSNLQDDDIDSNYRVKSDAKGSFEIAGQIERYALIVISADGYGRVDRAADERPGEIRIQPWAKVTATVQQGSEPIVGEQVYLRPVEFVGGDEPRMQWRFWGHTGADGTIVFERVPPFECYVSAYLSPWRESPLKSSRSMPLNLKPGEHAQVSLGGGGSEITGRLIAENQPKDFDYHFSLSYLLARRSGIEPPSQLAAKGFSAAGGWSDAWRSSQEGMAFQNTLHHWFVKPDPEGKFRISGVEPGDYDFAVNLYGSTEGCLIQPKATRLIRFTVPSGETNLDLGELIIPSLAPPLKVGDLAGDFEFVDTDGVKESLAGLRGKYVLLDFWATWCGPCVANLPQVEHLRKEFEPTGKLVVLGANLDADSDHAREFIKAKSLGGRHALLGDWSATDTPKRFSVSSVPAYFFIDPAGKILAQEYLVEKIAEKLKAELAIDK